MEKEDENTVCVGNEGGSYLWIQNFKSEIFTQVH